jgi:hypothetical protein
MHGMSGVEMSMQEREEPLLINGDTAASELMMLNNNDTVQCEQITPDVTGLTSLMLYTVMITIVLLLHTTVVIAMICSMLTDGHDDNYKNHRSVMALHIMATLLQLTDTTSRAGILFVLVRIRHTLAIIADPGAPGSGNYRLFIYILVRTVAGLMLAVSHDIQHLDAIPSVFAVVAVTNIVYAVVVYVVIMRDVCNHHVVV